MSIVNVGQTFYGFGWEMLLLEAGFTVAFLGSDQTDPPRTILILVAWLVFRLEFGAGMIKIRGGREWRDLTALYYHHETQPMPGPLSRQAHLLPKPFHRLEVLGNHFAQLVVPFFLFAPQPAGQRGRGHHHLHPAVAGGQRQLRLAELDRHCAGLRRRQRPRCARGAAVHPAGLAPAGRRGRRPLWWLAVTLLATLLLVVLSYWPLRNLFSRRQLMNASFNRWQLVNTYGAFGTVTKQRIEIVVEGTLDEDPDDAADWREYGFKGKPGRRAPAAPPVGALPPAAGLADVVPAAADRPRGVVLCLPRQAAGGGPADPAAPPRMTRSTANRRAGCASAATCTVSPPGQSSGRPGSGGSGRCCMRRSRRCHCGGRRGRRRARDAARQPAASGSAGPAEGGFGVLEDGAVDHLAVELEHARPCRRGGLQQLRWQRRRRPRTARRRPGPRPPGWGGCRPWS